MAKLGNIKKVSARSEWAMEPLFSSWLSEEENLNSLAKELGLDELELKSTEFPIGPYKADIVASEVSSKRYVVIENQYGKTDHDHLGKLLTYGSSLEAGTVVWIAENFTEEHKTTLDWLNDNTTNDLSFFGVQVELWTIDESRPAIRFNVVSSPNAIIKQIKTTAKGDLSDIQKYQTEFWELVAAALLKKNILRSARAALPQHWYDLSLGKSGVWLTNTVSMTKGWLRIQVRTQDQSIYEQLVTKKEEIESSLGTLIWDCDPERKAKIIGISEHSVDIDDKNRWPEYADWMVEKIAQFRKVFVPILKTLK